MFFQICFLNNKNVKRFISCVLVVSSLFCVTASAFQLKGLWKSVDENTNEPTSIVQFWKSPSDNEYYGKIVYLYPQKDLVTVCNACEGANKDRNVKGMTIVNDLKLSDQDEYTGGSIINPKNGKVYDLKIVQLSSDKIKLRGYILGISFLGRTQYWTRYKGSLVKLSSSTAVNNG